jgi:flagellar motility protein MotE (MotC chaperone)
MKKFLPYIIVFVVTTLATTATAVMYVVMRPPAATVPLSADSTAAEETKETKEVKGKTYGPTPAELQGRDSTHVGAPLTSVDSTKVLQLALEDERKKSAQLADRLRAVMDSSKMAVAAADSAQGEQRKSMTKVLENMDPTSAARILNDFPDGDVKTVLLTMKKRQAAKILAALQPDRAARIMR